MLAARVAALWVMAGSVLARPTQTEVASPAGAKASEDPSMILFGDRGILTGIFRMMDQQRKVHPPQNHQQDAADSTKIGPNSGQFDFKKIVDALVMGSGKGELGDVGVEMPEFLGICNRLSCGDIYKAIDKFRKSEMFSNFQTALTLVQDPNGWETIGKLLSNPELISQFTSGSGMEELFGSALGVAKKESSNNKNKNSKLMPEDGDFGTDFSEDGDVESANKTETKSKIDFSIDPSPEDYYGEVAKKGGSKEDEEYEHVTVDVAPPTRPSTAQPKPSTTASIVTTTSYSTNSITISKLEKLPEISFSIDEEGEEPEVITDQRPKIRIQRPVHVGNVGNKVEGIVVVQPKREESPKELKITTTQPVTLTTSTTSTSSTTTTSWTRRTTTTQPSTTAKNFRKDNDYYVMYYDDSNNG